MNFERITACGECCDGCEKHRAGTCPGCIEADGKVPEWKESGGCPIHGCARRHGVQFCGLCGEFPCDFLRERLTWNPDAIPNLGRLAARVREEGGQ